MNKPRPILLAVRVALGTAIATTPALIATAVGVAHWRVAEPIARCQHGQEVAVCAGRVVAEERELHREEIVLPPEQVTELPPGTRGLEAALTLPIRRIPLPDVGFAMGTPLPLLVSAT